MSTGSAALPSPGARDCSPPAWLGGDGAVASHRAAAGLWDLAGARPGAIEISVPRGRRVRLDGITVHQPTALARIDTTILDGIPVTTATRTLIDLAAVLSADAVEEALDDALRRGLTSISGLRWRAAELGSRGRPGTRVVRRLLAQRADAEPIPESVLETRFLRSLTRAGLPLPHRQYEIRERGRLVAIVDFAYPEARLAIETDGYRWHSGRARWERDLARRNALTLRRWRVLHVTWNEVERASDRLLATIASALGDG